MRHRLTHLFSLFIAPLLLAAGVLLVITFNLLPSGLVRFTEITVWLFALIGLLLTLAYARTRNFFAILFVFLSYQVMMKGIQLPVTQGTETPVEPATVYNLLSFLLPSCILVNSLWPERFHLLQDKLLRLLVFGLFIIILLAIGHRYPAEVNGLFNPVHFPALYIEQLGLPQLSLFAFIGSLTVLFIQLLINPQPYYAAQWVALVAMVLALPHFHHEYAPALVTSLALIMLSMAVLQEAFQMAFRDDLTGLPGRRALNERLQRLGRNYAIAMSDVDKFKVFNDTYGHDLGDQVLKMVAAQLKRVGGGGKAYRYGGEEFTLVFPGKTAEEAKPHLEKLRIAIENYQVKIRDESKRPKSDKEGKQKRNQTSKDWVSVTISMGIAERGSDLGNPEEVIKAADQALYKAKKAGRNQIALAK
ncbi:diguanylate cyclase (GGDEF) domain-containing protein [Marinospirillum celere]|uniref:diguanylate cyclase n=1 Tax=Marinospirillum celere TaxID=1122252 RepID=A0A1I1JUF8_9GAMM|nr:GGDEF domain-containing protein [Marinospirillum celere]SFC50118.1 diguanylate cyclase (GGDEF) domain-containing protein [Marinospirillum celere]